MLVASRSSGDRIEASRDLDSGTFTCPLCRDPVILKRGRVKIPHFAHTPGSECTAAGESVRHLMAKRVMVQQLRSLGYGVVLEDTYPALARRVDVAVSIPGEPGYRVAVEVQDSPIRVEEMKRRNMADRRAGFVGTAWVFTGRRHSLVLPAQDGAERRLPDEMLWYANRYQQGLNLLDEQAGRMWQIRLGYVTRLGGSSEWYEPGGELASETYPDRVLRSTKTVHPIETGFRPTFRPTKYDKPSSRDIAITFEKPHCHV